MAIQTSPYTINPTKETKEVIDALLFVVAEIRAKKPFTAIMGSSFPKFALAVEGIDKLDDEAKSKNLDDNLAYIVKQVGDTFIPSARGEEGTL